MEEDSGPISEPQRQDLQQRLVDNFNALLFHREVNALTKAQTCHYSDGSGFVKQHCSSAAGILDVCHIGLQQIWPSA